MKTKKELFEIKQEYEKLSIKLRELTKEELKLVTGGAAQIAPAENDLIALFLPAKPPEKDEEGE